MREQHDLSSMKAMGSVEASKGATGSTWSEEEVETMLGCLADLHSGADAVHVLDTFYFLSHHGLSRQKSPSQLRALLQHVEREYGL